MFQKVALVQLQLCCYAVGTVQVICEAETEFQKQLLALRPDLLAPKWPDQQAPPTARRLPVVPTPASAGPNQAGALGTVCAHRWTLTGKLAV